MIKKLVILANELDNKGFYKEVDYLDSMIKNATEEEGEEHEEKIPSSLIFPIDKGEWEVAKHKLRRYQVREPLMDPRDISSIQKALDDLMASGSVGLHSAYSALEEDTGYLVVDPFGDDFSRYTKWPKENPPGGETVVVPLTTYELEGKRINYFKTVHSDKYGKLEEDT